MKKPEKFDEYTEKYVDLVKIVQTTDVSDIISVRANDLYRKVFGEIRDYVTEEEYGELMRLFDAIPDRDTMVHSDLHARNVMVQNGELLLIDMDEIMCGHPIYDLCNLYLAYKDLPKQRSDAYIMQYFGMSAEMCARFIKKLGEIFFSGLNAEQFRTVADGMEVFAQMRFAYARLIHLSSGLQPRDAVMKSTAQLLRDSVLPHTDLAIKALDFI